jgi:hypothetical protein
MTAQTIKPGRRAATAAAEPASTDPTRQPPRDPAQRRRQQRDKPRELRKRARPHLLLAGLLAAAELAHVATLLTGQAAIVAGVMATALLVITLVAVMVAHHRRGYRHVAWALVCAAGAAGWLAATSAAGVSWDAAGVLTVLGYALALPWWRRHRLVDPAEPLPELDIPVGEIPRLWGDNVGGHSKHGVLPGSYLSGREEIRAGERYKLHLVPGKHTFEDVAPNLRKIAGGLHLSADRLIIEPYRPEDPTEPVSEALLQLTVVTRSPIPRQGILWPGPRVYRDGRIELGPYVDGEGAGCWRLYTADSMWGGFIVGGIGSGKSRTMDAVSLASAATGTTTVWYADGQDGASSPGLAGWYDWFATGVLGIALMLEAACRVLDFRQDENLVEGWQGFTPARQRPGLLILIDECHTPLAVPEIQQMVGRLAREGRKCGIALILADQLPTLNVFGPTTTDAGNAIRSSILQGNLAALNTTYNGTAGLLPGLPIDPKTLPAIPGYLYLSDRSGEGRSAALRTTYVADPVGWSKRIPMPGLETGSATAAGDAYQRRHQVRERARAAAAERVQAMRTGRWTASAVRPKPATAPAPATPQPAGQGQIIAFPTFPPATPAPTVAQQQPAGPVSRLRLNDGQRQVLTALLAGRTSPGEIQTVTGRSESGVRLLLGQLADAGLVRKAAHGTYEPTHLAHQASS